VDRVVDAAELRAGDGAAETTSRAGNQRALPYLVEEAVPTKAIAQRQDPVAGDERGLLHCQIEDRRFAMRYDRLGLVVRSLLQTTCTFLVCRPHRGTILKTAS
jgi:hypothetical protein